MTAHELHGWPQIVTNYAPASGTLSGSSGNRCRRCQAKLRRGNRASLCAPCEATTNRYTCPICGRHKSKYATRCRDCENHRPDRGAAT